MDLIVFFFYYTSPVHYKVHEMETLKTTTRSSKNIKIKRLWLLKSENEIKKLKKTLKELKNMFKTKNN